ncbi:MAG: hypothetical protein ACI9SE_004475, partial [Neolewinella sp.]
MTDQLQQALASHSRRRFFGQAATGLTGMLGSTALASMGLAGNANADAGQLWTPPSGPLGNEAQGPHFAPKAKRVIYLHMEGGPSHLDLFDHKPDLHRFYNTELP